MSEDEDLFAALAGAMRFTAGLPIEFVKSMNALYVPDTVPNLVLLFDAMEEGDFYTIRNEIRFKRKLLNPIAAFCYEPLKIFNTKNDDHHYFFHVPFEMEVVIDNLNQLSPISSQQKLYEYFPAWLKDDDHTIQNWLLASGKSSEAIKLITGLVNIVNPSVSVRKKAKGIINALSDSAWRKNAYEITADICDLLNDLYGGSEMKDNILVVDDEITEGEPLWSFFKELSSELDYDAVFVQNPDDIDNNITQRTKFAFLDVEFKGHHPNTVNELREKIKPIPYIILSKHSQNPIERLDPQIQESVKALSKLLSDLKKKRKIEEVDLADPKYTIDTIGKIEKDDLIEDIEGDIDLPICQQETKVKDALITLKKAIKKSYPSDIYPEIKRCLAYIEKKEIGKKKALVKELISSATKSPNDSYEVKITDAKNRIITVIEKASHEPLCDVSLDHNKWAFFYKCYSAYPNAAAFKEELEALKEKKKKAKFYDSKYQIENTIKEKSGGRIISIFERIGKGLFKLSISPHNADHAKVTSEKQIDVVTRAEFDELKNMVHKMLSILEKDRK